MAAKKGKKKAKGAARKSNKRPLKFLKKMESKMRANLPKLQTLIKQREARGEK